MGICKFVRRMMGKRPPHLEVFQGLDGQWRTRIRAANGEILQSSEAYSSESNAWRAVRMLASHTGLEVKDTL